MRRASLTTPVLLGLAVLSAAARDLDPTTVPMPQRQDYTLMSWAGGFPGHSPGAPWRRVVQTGRYALALDTDTMRIPHLGPMVDAPGYLAAACGDDRAWQALPPADLKLTITADGRTYHCTAGGRWTQFTGPRLIESGRFVQRADVTDLVFTADDGTALNVEARFETVAWPDRLALILAARPRGQWTNAALDLALTTTHGTLRGHWSPPNGQPWAGQDWREASLAFDPVLPRSLDSASVPQVTAAEVPTGRTCPVTLDPVRGWQRINLDGIEPILPPGGGGAQQNDAIERVKLTLVNPTADVLTARLMFEKTGAGIRQRIGSPITGLSAILRHPDGSPTGLPVQLSKNWHGRPEGGVHAGTWFHGFSQVRLPPNTTIGLELAIAYGHWGGVAAASHAQLCLVGWGSNQLWDESALGSWGESICYEPDQVQADCGILDVRPLMVRSMDGDRSWNWTHNVGGGDFLRLFDPAGRRLRPAAMRTAYLRQGPCLTEVTYAGRTGPGIRHRATVSLARTDDVVRGTYRLRMDVTEPVDFSRFVIFQIGSDSYSYTGERRMALGNEGGLTREWSTQWGGDTYRMEPVACEGRVPWVSLHEAVSRAGQEARNRGRSGAPGAWANRGVIIRAWRARLGGRPTGPWMAERGVRVHGIDTSTVDLVPPPGVTRLLPGDFIEATFEHLVVPQFAADYYGPNEALRSALREHGNSWRMIHREACGNDRTVTAKTGTLVATHPAVEIRALENVAEFTLAGGLGYVPLTLTGLTTARAGVLTVDGVVVDQSVHGADFWQCDSDPESGTWSRTYNLAVADARPHLIRFTASTE